MEKCIGQILYLYFWHFHVHCILFENPSLLPKTDQLTHSTNIMCFILSWTDTEGVVPGRPRDLSVIEATKNYVVLSWKPPGDKGHEGVMYYVEKVREQNWINFITTAI